MLVCPMAAGEQCYMQCMQRKGEEERGGKVRERERGFVKIKAQITSLQHSKHH
jgi:hypothetical protein